MAAVLAVAIPVRFGERIQALIDPPPAMTTAPYRGVERDVVLGAQVPFPAWVPVPEGATRMNGVHFVPVPTLPEAGMALFRVAGPLPPLLDRLRRDLEAEGFALSDEAPAELAGLRGAAMGRDGVIGGRDGRGRAVAVMVLSAGEAHRPVQLVQVAWHLEP